MSISKNFKKIFEALRTQYNSAVEYEEEIQKIVANGKNVYSKGYLKEQCDKAYSTYHGKVKEREKTILDAMEKIKTELLNTKIDITSITLNNALSAINISGNHISDEMLVQIVENFKGNLPELKLLAGALGNNEFKAKIINQYIINPEIEFDNIRRAVTTAFSGSERRELYKDIRYQCLEIGQKMRVIANKLTSELMPDDTEVVEDENSASELMPDDTEVVDNKDD